VLNVQLLQAYLINKSQESVQLDSRITSYKQLLTILQHSKV